MCALVIHKEKYPVNLLMDMFPEEESMWSLTKKQKDNLEKVISETLTERHQKVLKLRYQENKTYDEISLIDGVSSTSIGTIIKRSVRRLGSERNRYLILNGYKAIDEFDSNKGYITSIKVYENWDGKLDAEIYRDGKRYRVIYGMDSLISFAELKEAVQDGFVALHKKNKSKFSSFALREDWGTELSSRLVYEANYRNEVIYEDALGISGCNYFLNKKKRAKKIPEVEGKKIPVTSKGCLDIKKMGLKGFVDIEKIYPVFWSSNFGEWVRTRESIEFMYGIANSQEDRLKRDSGWDGIYNKENNRLNLYIY